MKTDKGYSIEHFKVLDTPESRGNLNPFIYSGLVIDPIIGGKILIKWDKDGKCGNHSRSDCFITNIIKQ